MEIVWRKCASYSEARDYSCVIYLHEWHGKPFYWGKAHKSFFGGHKRTRDGLTATGRYANGYRHWIEGCLRHGGHLYIGVLGDEEVAHIDEIERYLIAFYPSEMNRPESLSMPRLHLRHGGDIPRCLLSMNVKDCTILAGLQE
ncbi:hypothetical protein [Caballeronia sp. 15711]|uniref:hypothetical protein n=1 Tax=Caballeronia sp. 15711 TaxID=3391029 RepID=UPI0039E471AB